MFMLRNRPKGVRPALFGFGLCLCALSPTETGYQDIASLLARQPGVAERWQTRVFSGAASIQLATYSFNRPIGTSTPPSASYELARFDQTVAGARNPILRPPPRYEASDFPRVNRALKADRLAIMPRAPRQEVAPSDLPTSAPVAPAIENTSTPRISVWGAKTAAREQANPVALDPELQEALNAAPLPQYDVSLSLEAHPIEDFPLAADAQPVEMDAQPWRDGFNIKTATLYFGSTSLGGQFESIERWQPGEEPLIMMPDPDMKGASIASSSGAALGRAETGESFAEKGEVNAENQRAKTPAERLGLFDQKLRAKSEKCLAEAVYFEARGEAVRGQIAVAQVVMNRVFSGFYPATVCGVVYQSKYRHFACQFTFACDNGLDVIREPEMWERAKKIATAMLDGQLWLPEVGKSTHYHAYWVRPSWVAEMRKMYRFGVHTFYRPRAWGDGQDAPSWGSPQQTAAISAELAQEAKSEAEMSPNSVRR
jgi:spore germination cell wall hydrolase CwlJ-like protein